MCKSDWQNSEEDAFDVPSDCPDAANRIAAYYFWLFPNMMFQLLSWGFVAQYSHSS